MTDWYYVTWLQTPILDISVDFYTSIFAPLCHVLSCVGIGCPHSDFICLTIWQFTMHCPLQSVTYTHSSNSMILIIPGPQHSPKSAESLDEPIGTDPKEVLTSYKGVLNNDPTGW